MATNTTCSQETNKARIPIATTLVLPKDDDVAVSMLAAASRSSTRIVQRIVTPHPLFPDASIETVWEALYHDDDDGGNGYDNFNVNRSSADTPWMQRVVVYSGPDATPRTLHVSFELPIDADPQQTVLGENANINKHPCPCIMTWATFENNNETKGTQQKSTLTEPHPVLCVLVHPTSLCMWDVYPSQREDDDHSLSLPAEGWTMTLPFECSSILANPTGGLLLQRLEYPEDAAQQRVNISHQHDDYEDDGFILKPPPQVNRNNNSPQQATTTHSHSIPPAGAAATTTTTEEAMDTTTSTSATAAMAVPSLFSLEHPLDDILPVCEIPVTAIAAAGADPNGTTHMLKGAEAALPITDVHEKLVWMGCLPSNTEESGDSNNNKNSQNDTLLLVTYHTQQRQHAVWQVRAAPPPPQQMPLYQQTRRLGLGKDDISNKNNTANNLILMLEDLDDLLLEEPSWMMADATTARAAEPAFSRKEALADALGVRRTPRSNKAMMADHVATAAAITAPASKRAARHRTPAESFLLASPTHEQQQQARQQQQLQDVHDMTHLSTTAAGQVAMTSTMTPLHARWALQCIYRETEESEQATAVFLVAGVKQANVLCLLCPTHSINKDNEGAPTTKALHFWSVLQDSKNVVQVIPRPMSLKCQTAQPITCFSSYDHPDLLVLTSTSSSSFNRLTLYRAWIPVAECSVQVEESKTLTSSTLLLQDLRDPVLDRITLIYTQELEKSQNNPCLATTKIRCRLSLQINSSSEDQALAERILCAVDAALSSRPLKRGQQQQEIHDDLTATAMMATADEGLQTILALKIHADVCRLLTTSTSTSRSASATSCVQNVVANVLETAWHGSTTSSRNKTVTEASQNTSDINKSAWEQLLALEIDQAVSLGTTIDQSSFNNLLSVEYLMAAGIKSDVRGYVATSIFDHLHFLFEDMKLFSSWKQQNQFGRYLLGLSQIFPNQNDSTVQAFKEYYMNDVGLSQLVSSFDSTTASTSATSNLQLSSYPSPPSILEWCSLIMAGKCSSNDWLKQACSSKVFKTINAIVTVLKALLSGNTDRKDEAVVQVLLKQGFLTEAIVRERFPAGIALPILEAISRCRNNQSSDLPNWSRDAWLLVGRKDLSLNVATDVSIYPASIPIGGSGDYQLNEKDFIDRDNDGLVPLERASSLLFSEDNRVREAARLLRSSRPIFLRVARAVEVSDHDYEKLKQKRLLHLSYRTLALPIGRGMMTIGSLHPLPAEPMPIPDLCLKGRVPPTNAGVSLDMSECPADMRVWPEFHNGVAAGLRLPIYNTSYDFNISRTWIVYNRPPAFEQNATDEDSEAENNELLFKNHSHGGLLLALGLRGHLNALEMSDLYEYLTQGTVTTTVGILLGMAANNRGTADLAVSKMLCLHIPSLIPQHFSAIDVASTVQAAAVIGSGLLFQGSSHRMMTEFLLNEIGKRPESDASAFDRESYTLACGLALGMVNLCIYKQVHGIDRAAGIADLRIEERLQKYVLGGIDMDEHTRTRESNDRFSMPMVSNNGDVEKCSTIFEGDLINTEVTAPGAALALGLMYMQSGNQSVASSLALPDTHFLLEFVRPDLLTLRIVSRSLILWDEVKPTLEWIESQIPSVVHKAYTQMGSLAKRAAEGLAPVAKENRKETIFDRRAVRQIYVHTVAGACFGMGLRFAGTGNIQAKEAIEYFVLELYALRESSDPVAVASKPELPILETCLGCAAISLAMVMAGTGDLNTLRILKMLRWRCDEEARYGFHMICGMAIGLLFLGGGTCTLGRDPSDIASLVVAFFPRFPVSTSDNQSHLQALRHLYALAVKRKEIRAVDVDSGECIQVPAYLCSDDESEPEHVVLPFLLRNSDERRTKLCILSQDYYPLRLDIENVISQKNGLVYVKKRPRSPERPYLHPQIGDYTSSGEPFLVSRALQDCSSSSFAVELLSENGRFDSAISTLVAPLATELGPGGLPLILSLCRGSCTPLSNGKSLELIRTYFENRTKLGVISLPTDPAFDNMQILLAYLLELSSARVETF